MGRRKKGVRSYLACKRYHVVFAKGEDLNVLDDDHLRVVLVEQGAIGDGVHVVLVALGEEEQGLGVARGRVQQALAVGVLAEALEYRAHGAAHLLDPGVRLLLRLVRSGAGPLGRPAQAVLLDDGDLLGYLLELVPPRGGLVPGVPRRLAGAVAALVEGTLVLRRLAVGRRRGGGGGGGGGTGGGVLLLRPLLLGGAAVAAGGGRGIVGHGAVDGSFPGDDRLGLLSRRRHGGRR